VSQQADIKILVATHKPAYFPDNPLLCPIQTGTALSNDELPAILHDNTGANISEQTGYAELRAVYWAWKNLDADYFGLFHYRRYFSFAPNSLPTDPYGNIIRAGIPSSIAELGLEPANMRSIIESHDLIIPVKIAIPGATSAYDHYRREHVIRDLDFALAYIAAQYPALADLAVEEVHSPKSYYCNMFVMRKDLFHEYCEFLFDVLGAFESTVDTSKYNLRQSRAVGYLGERLTSIFFAHLIRSRDLRVKELQVAYFEHTDPPPEAVEPVSEQAIPIVLASSDFYVPYISTLIHSIAHHAEPSTLFDIIVFHEGISPENKLRLKREFADNAGISIRFVDFKGVAAQYQGFHTFGQFSIETYFRLFITDIMQHYDKVIYLDGDLIVNTGLEELYGVDLDGYLLAACHDPDYVGQYNGFAPELKPYVDEVLKLANPFDYFQAGVVVFNMKAMREQFTSSDLLKLANARKWKWLDQDILNFVAQGQVLFLDQRWNVMHDNQGFRVKEVISLAPVRFYSDYQQARKNPAIIHFAGFEKPWNWPECDFAEYFWRYARSSGFEEVIFSRMVDAHVAAGIGNRRLSHRLVTKMYAVAHKLAAPGTRRRAFLKRVKNLLKR
jgi:lipopolysaccharide biosynthesis glycosyltransferase